MILTYWLVFFLFLLWERASPIGLVRFRTSITILFFLLERTIAVFIPSLYFWNYKIKDQDHYLCLGWVEGGGGRKGREIRSQRGLLEMASRIF